MAGSQEIRSSFVEGLEDISEEEQLKMALEMSKNDVFGQSEDFEPSPTNMSVDSNRSSAELDFDKWIRTPVEERLQFLSGAAGATSEIVRDNVTEVSTNDDTYESENEDEDEDDIMKRIIEQSKHELFLSEEDKTKIALEQSELDAANNVPMDTLDENEQLEAAIKMSLGATYERLMKVPRSPSVSSMTPNPPTPVSITPPPTTPPPITPPLSTSPQHSVSTQSVRPKTRPTSLSSHPKVSLPEVQLPSSSQPGAMYISPPMSPTPVHQPPPAPVNLRSPSRPCPLPSHVKNQLNIATSPNRFSPLAKSPTSPRRLGNGFPPLTEEEQLEMALKMSQEEAEKKDVRQMSEEDQIKMAMRLSRSESACTVGGNSWQAVRQKRASGSGGGLHPHNGVRSLPPLVPSQSSPNVASQFSQKKTSQPSMPSTSQCSTTTPQTPVGGLRLIVVDGSNVGMAMGKNEAFRAQALSIVYAWFAKKGHEVVIFLPRSRWNRAFVKDRELLDALFKKDILVYTPSRKTDTGCWDSYDDRYIVEYAAERKGIIVTNDNYRDLITETPEFRDQIENRLLPFTWFKDQFLPPADPMGKNGPRLTEFLRH